MIILIIVVSFKIKSIQWPMRIVPNVRAMLSFVQAADHGSFAAAARRLELTPAAIGKNIAELETALGVRLMNRTTRSLRLTAEGQEFLLKAREALNALSAAVESVSGQQTQLAGKVRISTSGGFGRHFLLPLLPGLHERFPAIIPDIVFDDRQVDIIREGFDLAFRGGLIEDSSLISRRVCSMRMVLVASPTYLSRHTVPVTPSDLAGHQLIAVRFLNGRTPSWTFNTAQREIMDFVPDSASLFVSDPEAAAICAASGLGIAQIGLHYAWRYLKDGSLKLLLRDHHRDTSGEMALIYPHRALIAARVRATIDFLAHEFAKMEALQTSSKDISAYTA